MFIQHICLYNYVYTNMYIQLYIYNYLYTTMYKQIYIYIKLCRINMYIYMLYV